MPGYISLHRDIQKHWLYKEERVFSRYEAWLDILMRVNHSEGKVAHNGTLETVERGSTIWSMGDMEKHWGWSNKKVKRFLDCLANDQMLSYKSTTKKTYLTVINYDFYQDTNIKKAPPKHHEGTANAFQKHTNNNVNNLFSSNSHSPKNVFGVYQSEIGDLSETIKDELIYLELEYTEEWVKRAIKEAVIQDVKKMSYIKGTLKNWKLLNVDDPWNHEKQPSNVTQFPKGGQPNAKHGTGHAGRTAAELDALSL